MAEEFKDPFSALYELGLLIFVDDVQDLPKGPFRSAEEVVKGDFPVHHWLYGVSLMVASALGKVWYAMESSRAVKEVLQARTV